MEELKKKGKQKFSGIEQKNIKKSKKENVKISQSSQLGLEDKIQTLMHFKYYFRYYYIWQGKKNKFNFKKKVADSEIPCPVCKIIVERHF